MPRCASALLTPLRVRALRALARRVLCTGQTRGDNASNNPAKNSTRIQFTKSQSSCSCTTPSPTFSSSTRKVKKKLKYKMTIKQGIREGLQPSNCPPCPANAQRVVLRMNSCAHMQPALLIAALALNPATLPYACPPFAICPWICMPNLPPCAKSRLFGAESRSSSCTTTTRVSSTCQQHQQHSNSRAVQQQAQLPSQPQKQSSASTSSTSRCSVAADITAAALV